MLSFLTDILLFDFSKFYHNNSVCNPSILAACQMYFIYIIRYRRVYNKRTQNWFVVAIKTPKRYIYIKDLQKDVLTRRQVADDGFMHAKLQLPQSHPKRIQPHLGKTLAPPTADLIQKHQSRLKVR